MVKCDPTHQLVAVHLWHRHIGEHNVEGLRRATSDCVEAVGCGRHLEAGARERDGQQRPNLLLVNDHKNAGRCPNGIPETSLSRGSQ